MKSKPATVLEIPSAKFLSESKSNCERLIKEAFGYVQNMDESATGKRRKSKSLLQEHSLLNTRKLSFHPSSIEVRKDGTICICAYSSEVLYLLDNNGDIREFKLENFIFDIAVHPVSDALYCLLYDNSVRLVDTRTGRTNQLFVPEGRTYSLAFANDGNMLVGDYDKPLVTVYSAEFKKIKTVRYKGNEPRHIVVCRSTGRIGIACCHSGVLVLDSDFAELYRCPPDDTDIQSYDAIFDGYGHLLVSDWRRNKGVHIVNAATGQHLKTVKTNQIRRARCLTLNHDEHMVV